MYFAIMGYGTVGSGVAKVFEKNHDSIVERSMQKSFELKYILDKRDFPGDPNESLVIHDFDTILNDDEVKIVVETMGGVGFAYSCVKACLEAGKSVVTSNKELVAAKGYELLQIAEEKNVNFLFEASVGGGIPIIRPITQCLAANEIKEVAGILNGTTNFILTKMITENMSFEDALKLAQDNGYAELDPTADIEGHDACRKICILASLCFGKHVYPDSVYTEGITKISLDDIEYLKSINAVVKLLGRAVKIDENQIYVMVSPAVVKKPSQLASVDDVFNAILVRGDAIGDVVFYGRGAGMLPTASAVVADVIDCAKHTERKRFFGWDDCVENYVADYMDMQTSLYVRAKADDVKDAVAKAEKLFGEIKLLSKENADANEFAFITPEATERELRTKLDTLGTIETLSVIRVTDY